MRTIHRSIARFVPLAGMGVMVAGLFGDPALPVASAADVEPFAYQNDWGNQNPQGQHDYRGTRDPWGYRYDRPRRRELGYELPDRYTIHKGKKCEVQCTRLRGTREYSCREYRC
jgi:hypothetical protein